MRVISGTFKKREINTNGINPLFFPRKLYAFWTLNRRSSSSSSCQTLFLQVSQNIFQVKMEKFGVSKKQPNPLVQHQPPKTQVRQLQQAITVRSTMIMTFTMMLSIWWSDSCPNIHCLDLSMHLHKFFPSPCCSPFPFLLSYHWTKYRTFI